MFLKYHILIIGLNFRNGKNKLEMFRCGQILMVYLNFFEIDVYTYSHEINLM